MEKQKLSELNSFAYFMLTDEANGDTDELYQCLEVHGKSRDTWSTHCIRVRGAVEVFLQSRDIVIQKFIHCTPSYSSYLEESVHAVITDSPKNPAER